MNATVLPYAAFTLLVLVILAFDLGVLNRKAHVVRVREAGLFAAFTATLALLFAGAIWMDYLPVHNVGGSKDALEFLTGYVIELALSVDNIFVFVLIFAYFKVPPQYQHRVLFWGVLGALVMRGLMIAAGAILIDRFHWIIYLFGAFLVYTGIKMATQDEMDIEPESNPALKLIRRFFPVTNTYHGQHFFVKETIGGKLRKAATPLFVVLVMVETTDLIFAVDSIPAIFAVTRDPFLVYTSNVFAILCLRSLYFLLAGVIDKFHYLKLGLSVVLGFIGVKMLISGYYHVPIALSLGIVAGVLAASVIGSLMFPKEVEEHPEVTHDPLDPSDDPARPILPQDDRHRESA
ncbi:MAG TPA: TerC family protein [Longimicrobium sp.]|nr:TerC family protein [Longimicrobium sp.]HEX6039633.1 TerC family protein [Longimicrobium sp.]